MPSRSRSRTSSSSLLTHFPEEFVDHLEGRGCQSARELIVPKLLDLADGVATYDEHQLLKQPDWTYSDGAPADA